MYKKNRLAFTMIELVFVIVILGILASLAVPKFTATRTDAELTKGKADISSIRSAIVSDRQARLITGDSAWITDANLDTAGGLFGGVLMYPITNKDANGHWHTDTVDNGDYDYKVAGVDINFDYDSANGKFDCNTTAGTATQQKYCKILVQ